MKAARAANKKRTALRTWREIVSDRQLYWMILPGILCVLVFSYLPMYGLVLAFKTYKPKLGILGSPWCGWENFAHFFSKNDAMYTLFNTLRIGVCNLLIGFPIPIVLSLLLNELRGTRFKRTVQSVLYLPHFISWVVIYSLLYSLFSLTAGIVNKTILALGGSALNILSDPAKFRGLVYATSVWKGAGWGTIIYMAAIAGVDPQMYEAAYLD
ncbi:MAG: sugar ABC transporter permease, partial [Clostridia bacterium]